MEHGIFDPEVKDVLEHCPDFAKLAPERRASVSDLNHGPSSDHIVFRIGGYSLSWLVLNLTTDILDLHSFKMVLLVQDLERIWIGLNDKTQFLVILKHDELSSLVGNRIRIPLEVLSVDRSLSVRIDLFLEPQVIDENRQLRVAGVIHHCDDSV